MSDTPALYTTLADLPAILNAHNARLLSAETVTVECSGDAYGLSDVLDYLQMRGANPYLEAANEFLILLQAQGKAAEARAEEAARELTYEQQMRQQTEAAMITLVEQVAGLKVELAEQEKEKFQLIRELSLAVGASPVAAR